MPRRTSPKTYTKETVSAARQRLSALPKKDKAERTLVEAIADLKNEIEAALKNGYSPDEIVASLKDDSIEITVPTLKSYLRKTARKTARAKAGKPAGDAGG